MHNINNLFVHLKSSILHNLNQADWSISPGLLLPVLAHFHFSNTNHLWEVLLRKANHTSHTSVFPPASMISKGKQPTVAYSYMCIIIKAHVSFIYFSKQLWHIGSPLKLTSRKHWFGGRVEVIRTCSWGKVPVSQCRQLVQPPAESHCYNKHMLNIFTEKSWYCVQLRRKGQAVRLLKWGRWTFRKSETFFQLDVVDVFLFNSLLEPSAHLTVTVTWILV